MLPSHIMHELMRRLPSESVRMLTQSVGIEADQPLPEADPRFREELTFSGAIDFDLTIAALGHCMTIPARWSWTAELTDDVDPATGEPIRVFDCVEMVLQPLIWTRGEPQLGWTFMDERMLPPGAFAQLEVQTEEQARMLERSAS